MSISLTPEDYRDLFTSALPGVSDADTIEPDLRTLFTPDSHRLALEPDTTVVRGARGVGKTVWFKAIQDPLLRQTAADAYQLPRLNRIETHPGFGMKLEPDRFPGPAVLESLLTGTSDSTQIWTAVLLVALDVGEISALPRWLDRLEWVRQNPEAVEHALVKVDHSAADEGVTHLILFDALDRLHTDRTKADRLVGGILRLALDLRTRTRNLRAKVFIRHDMFGGSQLHFPDSSKLVANATDLTWTGPNLYGLLFHYLGNCGTELARNFRESSGRWREGVGSDHEERDRGVRRYVPPVEISGDRDTQEELFVRIAGRYMGTNHRKGHTYTWLPNHLMDGIGQVSPRSFLRALSKAVAVTRESYAGHNYALHYEGIRRGVQDASRIRVQEVDEDIPWVRMAVGALAEMQVPTDLAAIVTRWSERSLGERLSEVAGKVDIRTEGDVRAGPRNPHDYPRLVDELYELGIMTRRSNGRIDLPDVYRIAFDIGRRGGVPRIRN
jgi:hypothetical protein